jgi:hypothetical protein
MYNNPPILYQDQPINEFGGPYKPPTAHQQYSSMFRKANGGQNALQRIGATQTSVMNSDDGGVLGWLRSARDWTINELPKVGSDIGNMLGGMGQAVGNVAEGGIKGVGNIASGVVSGAGQAYHNVVNTANQQFGSSSNNSGDDASASTTVSGNTTGVTNSTGTNTEGVGSTGTVNTAPNNTTTGTNNVASAGSIATTGGGTNTPLPLSMNTTSAPPPPGMSTGLSGGSPWNFLAAGVSKAIGANAPTPSPGTQLTDSTKTYMGIRDTVNQVAPMLANFGPIGMAASVALPLVMNALTPKTASGLAAENAKRVQENRKLIYR